ncbi:hypothetical protein [Pseudoalteromonas luteoviolacea]|uniref:Uncharacterized protein n=1 Tax=Pseudoalteromonas luteoviolacea NCIMB 1942 TaxID=1365253 RepID=A0A167DIK5_9GAMM|nr:hypothetical protein [Pseudoalteromonas luteoviolacea]KZN48880.1 hypothetical protein N482_07015 [Pseudoalteromonas luteoviolacea NCIMB 1942]
MKKLLLGALLASGFVSLSASANTIFTCDGLVYDVRYNGYQYVIEFKNVYGVYPDSAKI